LFVELLIQSNGFEVGGTFCAIAYFKRRGLAKQGNGNEQEAQRENESHKND